MTKRTVFVFVICVILGVAVWALLYFGRQPRVESARESSATEIADSWTRALEKVKAERTDAALNTAIEIPPELRHYDDRHWFLATQVAEIEKHNVPTCQDFLDLAAMIQRGEMVAVPAVTDTYVLYGVGEKADVDEFTRFKDNRNIELYSNFGPEVRFSVQPASQNSIRDYESLWDLAKNFGGRTYNLQDSSERQAMKVQMLRSLRPQALKIMEEVALDYHRQFDRPLPVSSLVRPEQYQHALRRVNRNAVLIETPPHSTGLAFDIDYRYMSGAEQTFVMAELARLKKEGRIEVIRESNANYHVFVFVTGTRPGDDLITASLEKAKVPLQAANHASEATKKEVKPRKAKSRTAKSKTRKRRR
jgi:Family of unknown function (DUF5715)